MITKELQEYYENYFEFFASKGWKQLCEDLKDNIVTVNNLAACKDRDDLHYRKGQLRVLESMLLLEQTMNNAYESLTNELGGVDND